MANRPMASAYFMSDHLFGHLPINPDSIITGTNLYFRRHIILIIINNSNKIVHGHLNHSVVILAVMNYLIQDKQTIIQTTILVHYHRPHRRLSMEITVDKQDVFNFQTIHPHLIVNNNYHLCQLVSTIHCTIHRHHLYSFRMNLIDVV